MKHQTSPMALRQVTGFVLGIVVLGLLSSHTLAAQESGSSKAQQAAGEPGSQPVESSDVVIVTAESSANANSGELIEYPGSDIIPITRIENKNNVLNFGPIVNLTWIIR